jgi:hypothetical protein
MLSLRQLHDCAWYVRRKTPRSGASLKVRIGKAEAEQTIEFAASKSPHGVSESQIQETFTNLP